MQTKTETSCKKLCYHAKGANCHSNQIS